jgi:DNA-binding NtrC family response regulator
MATGMSNNTPVILLVEADAAYAREFAKALAPVMRVHSTGDGSGALSMMETNEYDAIVLSIIAGQQDNMSVLQRIRKREIQKPVMILATSIVKQDVLLAGRYGASEYLDRGDSFEEIKSAVIAAIGNRQAVDDRAAFMQANRSGTKNRSRFIGSSESVRNILLDAEIVSRVDSTVLIAGNNGTGKEVLARYIHWNSRRSKNAFVAVNCAAIPAGLVESELFGHEKGAFTGATSSRRGSFEVAAEGTLFLDEITEMPIDLQPKLLRALQAGEFSPVGSEKIKKSNARVICSSNRDLERAVKEGQLRQDLFYRINVVRFYLPPLRERKEDILDLARSFLKEKARDLGKQIQGISVEAEALLLTHEWPGNARELENLIERAVVFCTGNEIGPELLGPISEGAPLISMSWDKARNLLMRRYERSYLTALLQVHRGSVSKAAKSMGVSRQAFYKALDRTGLNVENFRLS